MKDLTKKLVEIHATVFFAGKAPFFPGTIGSLLGAVASCFFIYSGKQVSPFLFFIVINLILGVLSSHFYERIQSKSDPREIIMDEFVGQMFSIFLVCLFFSDLSLKGLSILLILNVLSFRFFDIVKPFPVSFFDKMKGGVGVMADDLCAALLSSATSCLVLQVMKVL